MASPISNIDDAMRYLNTAQRQIDPFSKAYELIGSALAYADEAVWALQEEMESK